MSPVFRFAPSPNGRLHLGHAYSALLNEEMARTAGARLLLRIEDTDVTRCTPELTQFVFDDLHWLGLSWETPVRVQSQDFQSYDAALQKLWHLGAVYPCFCSRKQAAEHALHSCDPDGQHHYGRTCRNLARNLAQSRMLASEAFGWRLKTENTAASLWGDVMIAKPIAGSSYHIAVVVDDALQKVTHVVRGRDMEAATSIHKLLQRHLGFPTPIYHHHDLLLDDAGQKLSKRINSQSLAELRRQGATANDLRDRLGFARI